MKYLLNYKLSVLICAVVMGVITNAFLWSFTLWIFQQATDLIPLHYTIYFGPDLLDYKQQLFLYPLIGSIILIFNTLLAYVFKLEILLSYLLIFSAVFAQIIIFLTELTLYLNYY